MPCSFPLLHFFFLIVPPSEICTRPPCPQEQFPILKSQGDPKAKSSEILKQVAALWKTKSEGDKVRCPETG